MEKEGIKKGIKKLRGHVQGRKITSGTVLEQNDVVKRT